MVGYCRGNAYCALLDGDNAIVETQDVKRVEDTGADLAHTTQSKVIEYHLSDENVILDNVVQVVEHLAGEHESELESMEATGGYVCSDAEREAGVNNDKLTHYPGIDALPWNSAKWATDCGRATGQAWV